MAVVVPWSSALSAALVYCLPCADALNPLHLVNSQPSAACWLVKAELSQLIYCSHLFVCVAFNRKRRGF